MNTMEWELIDDLPKRYRKFIRSDFIDENILSYSIKRGENLELISEFTYENDGKKPYLYSHIERGKYPAGTVIENNSEIELGSIHFPDRKIIFSGVVSNSYSIKTSTNGPDRSNEFKETYHIQTIRSVNNTPKKIEYLIEWIANLNISQYIWPHSVQHDSKTKVNRMFFSNNHSMTLSNDEEQQGCSANCCHLNIQGFNIYFGVTSESNLQKDKHPGFIIYEGSPDKYLRIKIRQALSFIIGSNILYLGYSALDKNMHIINFEAHTPNSMGGLFFKNPNSPPTKLMNNNSRYYLADSEIINKMVNNFITNYEKYDLSHISWLYWHATIAPEHLKAVCFGAVLEFTQKIFIKKNKISFNHSLVDKKNWKAISKSLLEVIGKAGDINESDKKVLVNKISNLNSTPQSIITERFFSALGLRLSEKELKSYSRRNDAAHGGKTPNDDFISLIREIKLLHILCNRVLISILSLADNYTDFYTIGHSFRKLSEPVSN